MAENPDSPPMEHLMLLVTLGFSFGRFPADMPCMDMAGDFPPPPEDFGPMMDGAPPHLVIYQVDQNACWLHGDPPW